VVATPWRKQAPGEDDLLHKGWRSNLRCRLLQGVNADTQSVHQDAKSLYGFGHAIAACPFATHTAYLD
jgi:hypothetical protein